MEGLKPHGISGEVAIEDLPVGLSYAEKNVELRYLIDAEMSEYSTLSVGSGSCIIKTVGQIEDSNTMEMVDGAITIYVIPQNHIRYDNYDWNNSTTCIITKIVPRYDMYGLAYSVSSIENSVEVVGSIPDDPDYGYIYPNRVPSVGAVINYVGRQEPPSETYTINHFDLDAEELMELYEECIVNGKSLTIKVGTAYYTCQQVYYANGALVFFYMHFDFSGDITIYRYGYDMASGGMVYRRYALKATPV